MKKILLTLASAVMLAGMAAAQETTPAAQQATDVETAPATRVYDKHGFGVHAGLNVSTLSLPKDSFGSSSAGAGFNLGINYEHLLLKNRPLYVETGLEFNMKNSTQKGEDISGKVNTYYLEIPLMVNYKLSVKPNITVAPAVGIYYAVGVGGKLKVDGDTRDLFSGSENILKRSDFGLRFSVTASYKRVSLTLGYALGLINMASDYVTSEGSYDDDYDDDKWGYYAWGDDRYDDDYGYGGGYGRSETPKIKTGNFFVSLGYRF